MKSKKQMFVVSARIQHEDGTKGEYVPVQIIKTKKSAIKYLELVSMDEHYENARKDTIEYLVTDNFASWKDKGFRNGEKYFAPMEYKMTAVDVE